MLKTIVIGASGYTGAELATLVQRHPHLALTGLYVSSQSLDAHKSIAQLHRQLSGVVEMPLLPLDDPQAVAGSADVVLLATAHEVSHQLAPVFLAAGCQVFDLSGAYRVNQASFYQDFYGFTHQFPNLLDEAVYGLAEWNYQAIAKGQLIAVPGCYPTASQLALKPICNAHLLDPQVPPVINAISGVSGAGRKASLNNSFCEVSLQAYGVFNHRHQPEISTHLDCPVIFTPHLGSFKRGILATITAKLKPGVILADITQAMEQAYLTNDKAHAVRLCYQNTANLQAVVNTGFCDLSWHVNDQHLILTSAIDNLLKGASSQAVQCINIRNNFPPMTAVV